MSEHLQSKVQLLVDSVRQVIVANPDVIRTAILGLLCQGHVLVDDYPGVGKTLLAKVLAPPSLPLCSSPAAGKRLVEIPEVTLPWLAGPGRRY